MIYNLKITDWQAALGCSQIEKLDGFLEIRRRNAQMLTEKLSDLQVLKDTVNDSGQSMTTSVDNLGEVNRNINEEIVKTTENLATLISSVKKSSTDTSQSTKTAYLRHRRRTFT